MASLTIKHWGPLFSGFAEDTEDDVIFPTGTPLFGESIGNISWFPGGAKTKSRLFVELNPCLASNVKQKCCRWMMFLANERCSMWYQRAQCSCTPIKLPFFGRELHFDVYTWPKPRIWRNMGGIYPHFLIYLFLLLLCVCSFFRLVDIGGLAWCCRSFFEASRS